MSATLHGSGGAGVAPRRPATRYPQTPRTTKREPFARRAFGKNFTSAGGYQNKKIGLKIKGLTFLRLFKRKTIGKYKEKPRKYEKIRGSLSYWRIFLFLFFAVRCG